MAKVGRKPRETPRTEFMLRLEPEQVAEIDACPIEGRSRNAKIAKLIDIGIANIPKEEEHAKAD
jgi:hypothetical protein